MRAALIVVEPPGFDEVLGLGHRGELVYGQTFVSQSAVQRFDDRVSHRFARPNEVELYASAIGPILEYAYGEQLTSLTPKMKQKTESPRGICA